MGTIIAEASLDELKKMVDAVDGTELATRLAASLAAYGFKGTISVNLEVTVSNNKTGREEARVTRAFSTSFHR